MAAPVKSFAGLGLQDESKVVALEPGLHFVFPEGADVTGWDDWSVDPFSIASLRPTGDYDADLTRTLGVETFKPSGAHSRNLPEKRVSRAYATTMSWIEDDLDNFLMVTDSTSVNVGTAVDGYQPVRITPKTGSNITRWGQLLVYIGLDGCPVREIAYSGVFTAEVAQTFNRTGQLLTPMTYTAAELPGLPLWDAIAYRKVAA